jgi:guanylate kinase
VEYRFVDDVEFARMVEAGELLEHDTHMGASYGTPRQPVLDQLALGVPVLLEIDLNGARQVRSAIPGAQLVFLAPPSFDELAARLRGRRTEDPERIRERLDIARIELAAEDEFDHVVVNDDIESAADRLVALMAIT